MACSEAVDVGTVMVIDQGGALRPSRHAYDKRVAGVISGGGDMKPGIVLDRKPPGLTNFAPKTRPRRVRPAQTQSSSFCLQRLYVGGILRAKPLAS